MSTRRSSKPILRNLIDKQLAYFAGEKPTDVFGDNQGCNQILSLAEKKILPKILKINDLGILTYSGQSGQSTQNLTYKPEIKYYAYEALHSYVQNPDTLDQIDGESREQYKARFEQAIQKMLSHTVTVSVVERYYLIGVCETGLAHRLKKELDENKFICCSVYIKPCQKTHSDMIHLGDTGTVTFYFDNHEKIEREGGMVFHGVVRDPVGKKLLSDTKHSYSCICICSHVYGMDLSDIIIETLERILSTP